MFKKALSVENLDRFNMADNAIISDPLSVSTGWCQQVAEGTSEEPWFAYRVTITDESGVSTYLPVLLTMALSVLEPNRELNVDFDSETHKLENDIVGVFSFKHYRACKERKWLNRIFKAIRTPAHANTIKGGVVASTGPDPVTYDSILISTMGLVIGIMVDYGLSDYGLTPTDILQLWRNSRDDFNEPMAPGAVVAPLNIAYHPYGKSKFMR